jgi:C1A family cysteine protease
MRLSLIPTVAMCLVSTTKLFAQVPETGSESAAAPLPSFTPQPPTYTTGPYPAQYKPENLAGTAVPEDFALTASVQAAVSATITKNPRAVPLGANVTYRMNCNPRGSSFDYRLTGAVQPPKDQNPCGSCFIFSATAAYEASWYLQNHEYIRVSEQQVLDCAKSAGDCGGGFHTRVFERAKQHGFVKESDYTPYHANSGTCSAVSGPYTAINWNTVYGKAGTPSVPAIKEALCVHGPVVAAMYSTDAFVGYKSGVFNEFPELDGDSDVNHDVLIVGWDDQKDAWLIKNTWGPSWWGEKGFGWIRYRSNNIGYGAAWIDAIKVIRSAGGVFDSNTELHMSANDAKEIGNAAVDAVTQTVSGGGPNSAINNPGQIFGGPNSVLRNPGQLLGGQNSVARKVFGIHF